MKQCSNCGSYNAKSRTKCFKCNFEFKDINTNSDNNNIKYMDIESAISSEFDSIQNIMGSFYINRSNRPSTREEEDIFKNFSFIISSITLMVHIAMADKVLSEEEQIQIEKDMNQYINLATKSEYENLRKYFGNVDSEIINNIFKLTVGKYHTGELNIDNIISDINLIYKNNIRKRYFFIRLCIYCAVADKKVLDEEMAEIINIATKLDLDLDKVKTMIKEIYEEKIF